MKKPDSLEQLLDLVVTRVQYLRVWEEIGYEDGVHIFQILDDYGFLITGTAENRGHEWFVVLDNGEREQCITDAGEALVNRVALAASGLMDSRESL